MVTARTAAGTVRGTDEGAVKVFKGIPYAAPPCGPLRFRPPQAVTPWTGVRDAMEYGPWAPQDPGALTALFGTGEVTKSEDCLTLNVWTPAVDGARRPVMVWIHGGAFVNGAGSFALYHGHNLAARGDVVVVTINYRLGVLGFAAHPSLRDEESGASGNWGLLDQIAALRWVQENIAEFGGDPSSVTVFGESAGSMSVSTLLGTPMATDLFRRAIAQSGGPVGAPMEAGVRTTEMVTQELGLDADVAALRDAPVERILQAQDAVEDTVTIAGGLPFVPVVDGAVLPYPPLEAIADGLSADVDLLTGTNREETTYFAIGDRRAFALDQPHLLRRLEPYVGHEGAVEAAEVYEKARADRGQPTTPTDLWFAIQSDYVFRVPCIRMLDAHRPYARSYTYLFTWPSPALGGILRSCHALELAFVFGHLDLPGMETFVGAGDAVGLLSRRMQDAWLAFARTGDPATGDLDPWPQYGRERTTMVLDATCGLEDAPLDAERAFWDSRM